jgi:cytochrome c peroxidase
VRVAAAAARAVVGLSLGACAAAEPRGPRHVPELLRQRLAELSPPALPPPPADPTNGYLGDPRLVELGRRLFFDPRFSGPLLDEANNGLPGTLGKRGETGKVSCASCHVPASGFLDSRSPRRQISLGAGWTRRRAPSLLDVGQLSTLMWDGRRDAAFSQPFSPIEDAFEFNSSRLFVAQELTRSYRAELEASFGPLPSLAHLPVLPAAEAGCRELPRDPEKRTCARPGADDEAATRIVVNMGKAIQAYTRELRCGRSRFDRWMDGDALALDAEEQAGALLFVGKAGCNRCHSGPYFSDQRFHNVGLRPDFRFFIGNFDDEGASAGLAAMIADPLNARGKFSDGYDRRHDALLSQAELEGAFRTPQLRCVSRRPSFMHTGQLRSLEDVVAFFDRGGSRQGFVGRSELVPLGLTREERAALVAFLRALDGDGPDAALLVPPLLPPPSTPFAASLGEASLARPAVP